MFTKSAEFYDVIYDTMKDYGKESRRVRQLIQKHKKSKGNVLLDVACGTGRHIVFLRRWFKVEGLDLDPRLLAIARKRNPTVRFHRGNMVSFRLTKRFDVITCLFSSIGYVKTLSALRTTIRNFSRHLEPGGVLVVEPWLTPESFKRGLVGGVYVSQPKLKIARINNNKIKGRLSIFDFHYLIATPKKVQYFTERHELGLFSHEENMAAFRDSGLKVAFYPKGLIGRGLYVAVKPLR